MNIMKKNIISTCCLLLSTLTAMGQNPNLTTVTVEFTTPDGKPATVEVEGIDKNSFTFIGGKGKPFRETTSGEATTVENQDLYAEITDLGFNKATAKAYFRQGFYSVRESGFCVSKQPEPTLNDVYTENAASIDRYDEAVMQLSLTSLDYMTTYYVRPFVTFYTGYTMYGGEQSFTTPRTIEAALLNESDLQGWRYYDAKSGVVLTKEAMQAFAGSTADPDEGLKAGIIQDLHFFLYADTLTFPQAPVRPEAPVIDTSTLLPLQPVGLRPQPRWYEDYEQYRQDSLQYEEILAENKRIDAENAVLYQAAYEAYQQDSLLFEQTTLAEYKQTYAAWQETCRQIAATNQKNLENGKTRMGRLKALAYRTIECTDGMLYAVKQMPADLAADFQTYFNEGVTFQIGNNVNTEVDPSYGNMLYTRNIDRFETIACDEAWGVPGNKYTDFILSSVTNPSIGINIPKYLQPRTYAIYATFVHPDIENDPRGYRFYTQLWEKQDDGNGNYTFHSASAVRIAAPAGSGEGNYFMTDGTQRVQTLFLGNYTFSGAPETMIQFQVFVTSSMVSTYSREMRIAQIRIVPVEE